MKGVKRGVVAAAAIASVLFLSACTTAEGGDDTTTGGDKAPYKVGFNDDLSGPISFAGLTVLAGFQTYIDYVNDVEGGVNGHPIEVQALDHRADGATSIANYKQLVDDFGALVVAGNSASGAWTATAPLAEQYQVSQIGFGNADGFFTEYNPYVYHTGSLRVSQVALMGQVIEDYLFEEDSEDLKIAAIGLDTASGPPFIEAIKELVEEKGWELVASQLVAPGATDCTAQAAIVAGAKPDVVLGSQTPGDDVVCFTQLKTNGYEGTVINNFSSPGEPTMAKLASDKWITMRATNWWADTTNEGTKALLEQAVEYGHIGQLGAFSSDGYVSAMLVVAALKECGDDCTGETVQKALEGLKNVDTGGIAGPALGYTTGDFGHVNPQARFFIWDDELGQSVPYTDWLCVPNRECDAAETTETPAP